MQNPNGKDLNKDKFKVYALIHKNKSVKEIYIGSTTLTLERRFSDHKRQFKLYNFHKSHTNMKNANIDINDFEIYLIKKYDNKIEMLEAEKYFIKQQLYSGGLFNFRDGTVYFETYVKKYGARGPYKGNTEYNAEYKKLKDKSNTP